MGPDFQLEPLIAGKVSSILRTHGSEMAAHDLRVVRCGCIAVPRSDVRHRSVSAPAGRPAARLRLTICVPDSAPTPDRSRLSLESLGVLFTRVSDLIPTGFRIDPNVVNDLEGVTADRDQPGRNEHS